MLLFDGLVRSLLLGHDPTREEAPEGEHYVHLHRFENSQWEGKYLAGVQRLVERQDSYSLF